MYFPPINFYNHSIVEVNYMSQTRLESYSTSLNDTHNHVSGVSLYRKDFQRVAIHILAHT